VQQIKHWVTTNPKQVGGGVVTLLALKMLLGGGGDDTPAVDEKYDQVEVTVPAGGRALEGYVAMREYAAGDILSVENPHMPGTVFQVKIPTGKERPGSSFSVKVPRCPKEVTVVVPAGTKTGSSIPITHPGRPSESFTVKVPVGKSAGSSFKVKLP
jgi:hypothetical protein